MEARSIKKVLIFISDSEGEEEVELTCEPGTGHYKISTYTTPNNKTIITHEVFVANGTS